ncbi:MAG TPA: LNR domain-containing protein [Gammaproteobacteria bacterium]
MPRDLHRAALIGLFGCAICLSSAVHAGGVFSSLADIPAPAASQWPVLRNQSQSVLGLYGGIVTVHTLSGQSESAILLILPTGYAAPVLSNGNLATFPVLYFEQPKCAGREYLSPTGDHPGLLPLPGIVYRSPASGQPVYVPQGRQPASLQVKSRLTLNVQQGIRCESFEQTLPLLAAEPNAPAVTGMNREGDVGAVSIGVESTPVMQGKRDRRMSAGTAASGDETEPADAPRQEECSPGCLSDAVGNGFCDTACYYDACQHDAGDCDAMDKTELENALANMCSPGCNREDIGDGFCDTACQTEACSQDGGDCAQPAGR